MRVILCLLMLIVVSGLSFSFIPSANALTETECKTLSNLGDHELGFTVISCDLDFDVIVNMGQRLQLQNPVGGSGNMLPSASVGGPVSTGPGVYQYDQDGFSGTVTLQNPPDVGIVFEDVQTSFSGSQLSVSGTIVNNNNFAVKDFYVYWHVSDGSGNYLSSWQPYGNSEYSAEIPANSSNSFLETMCCGNEGTVTPYLVQAFQTDGTPLIDVPVYVEDIPDVPLDGSFVLPCSMQEAGDGVSAGSCQGIYSNEKARAEVGINYHTGSSSIKDYVAIGYFIDENGVQGSNISVTHDIINPGESATLIFENIVSGFVSEFEMDMIGGDVVTEYDELIISIEEGPDISGVGKTIVINVIGASQTVEFEIIASDGEIIETLSFVASDQGDINLPWLIPVDVLSGTLTIKATDAFNSDSTTYVLENDSSESEPEPVDERSNDKITILGTIKNFDSSFTSSVTMAIYSPENNIMSLSQLVPKSDGTFSTVVNLSTSTFQSEGDYTIKSQWQSTKQDSVFEYEFGMGNISKSITLIGPIPESEPEPTPEYEPDYGSEITIVPDTGSGSSTDNCTDTEYGCYHPGIASVGLGGKVIFSNTDSAAHTFTAGNSDDGPTGEFDTSMVMAGNSYEWIADVQGSIPYFCMVHPWMDGLLIVGGDPIPEPTPEPSDDLQFTVKSNRSSYSYGDNIVISGTINDLSKYTTSIQIVVVGPDGNIVTIASTNSDFNGYYSTTFKAGGTMTLSGDYEIRAQHGSAKITNTFYYSGNSSPPIPEPTPEPYPEADDEITIVPTTGSGSSTNICVDVDYGCYEPGITKVQFGGKVIFSNTDSAAHTFSAGTAADGPTGEFDTSMVMAGNSYEWIADVQGSIPYFCMVHPWMDAILLVGEGTAPPPTPQPTPKDHIDLDISVENDVYDINTVVGLDISIENNDSTQNIAIEVIGPRGTTVISRSVSLGPDDSISFEFNIDENFKTGTYKIVATTSDGSRTEKDTAYFKVKSQFNSFKITSVAVTDQKGNPSDLEVGDIGFIKINLESNKAIATLVTVNIFDVDLTSIGIGSVKTTLSSGNSEIILSFMIPDDAVLGPAEIFVNAFSDWPSEGGVPLTSEVSAVEDIQ
jgi:plastocyanin